MVLTIPPSLSAADDFAVLPSPHQLSVRRAALELMARADYATVTVDDIVAKVGISRRTFFRLFTGKHQVISCDHAIYSREVLDFLREHDDDRTLSTAAEAGGLIVSRLTSTHEDAELRERLVVSDESLLAEENRWFTAYQNALADFLSPRRGATPPLEAEILAASIVVAVRVSVRDWLIDPDIAPESTFSSAIEFLRTPTRRRRMAIIETTLDPDEIMRRLEG